jgi:hypothetical protein
VFEFAFNARERAQTTAMESGHKQEKSSKQIRQFTPAGKHQPAEYVYPLDAKTTRTMSNECESIPSISLTIAWD